MNFLIWLGGNEQQTTFDSESCGTKIPVNSGIVAEVGFGHLS